MHENLIAVLRRVNDETLRVLITENNLKNVRLERYWVHTKPPSLMS